MIKILLIDRQPVTAQGIRKFLEEHNYAVINPTIVRNTDLVELIATHKPDLLIMDIPVPEQAGIQWLKREYSTLPVIGFTNIVHRNDLSALFGYGIHSHISKYARFDEIINGINAVLNKQDYLCTYSRQLLGEESGTVKFNIPLLSSREKQIILLIAEGKSDKDIADSLFLSYHTVRTHRKNISRKIGFSLKNAADLVVLVKMLNQV